MRVNLHRQLRYFARARAQWVGANLAAFAVLALSILSVSPEAHAWMHAHEDDDAHGTHSSDHEPHSPSESADHVCAVTLAQQGFCDTAPALTWPAIPQRILHATLRAHTAFIWSAPAHWLQPAQGPPSLDA